MKEYIKENTTLHPTNPAIKIYNSYTWISGVSPAGEIYIINNDGLYYENVKILGDSTASVSIPSGTVSYFYGASTPNGWLACDGSTYNVEDYPDLAVALGYSSSDTTFNVPDFRQCALKGANTTDGTGVITPAGIPDHSHTATLTHSHTVSGNNHTHSNSAASSQTYPYSAYASVSYNSALSSGTTGDYTLSDTNSDVTLSPETAGTSVSSGLSLGNIVRANQIGVNVIIKV